MKRLTPEAFLEKSREVWGDRWDYSRTHYERMSSKVTLGCSEHGFFTHSPQPHLKGLVGCAECNGQAPITRETFVARAEAIHGHARFDLSLVDLKKGGIHQPIILTCLPHGVTFTMDAWSFLKGRVGCWKCNPNSTMTIEKLIWRAGEAHPHKTYDYSQVDFSIDVRRPNTIGCPVGDHGFFTQSIDGHLSGKEGCPACSRTARLMGTAEFISRSRAIWGLRYGYARAQLTEGAKGQDVTLECPAHGDFSYSVQRHLNGLEGCGACRRTFGPSKGEKEVGLHMESLGLAIERGNRSILGGKEIDIYIPSLKLGIEYNGLYYHSEAFLSADYHREKWAAARDAGVRLLQVWEDDWSKRQGIVKNHLAHIAGRAQGERVAARKCTVGKITASEANAFLAENHIQGATAASVHLALLHNGVVVAVALFLKAREDYVLVRYATSAHVVGGHSKLVAHFERSFTYGSLITFADLTFSDGGLYRGTGWVEDKTIAPDYSYVYRGERRHKFGFRLARFRDDDAFLYRDGLTERELAQLNGLPRVWDAGKIRFTKPHPLSQP